MTMQARNEAPKKKSARAIKLSWPSIRAIFAIAATATCSLVPFLSCDARAADSSGVEKFYSGRQLTILVGFSAGGGYDLYARLLAQHIGDYLPGHPHAVVQNMPGSGSLTAALNILDAAPRDGSAIGTFVGQVPLYPILSGKKFDARRFNWIGSMTGDNYLCVASTKSAVKSWADMLTKTFVAGGNGPDSGLDLHANILRNLFGAKIKLVTGYPGTNDVKTAMLRGEVDGECGLSYSTLQTGYAQELTRQEIAIIAQIGLTKIPTLPDVPFVADLATPEQKQVLRLVLGPEEIARPFAAPPDVPGDRLEALRAAFDKAIADPGLRADAGKAKLDINPIAGAEMAKMVDDFYAAPAPIVELAKKAIAEPE